MRRIVGALLCAGMLCLVAIGASNLWSCYSPPIPLCGFQCNATNRYACPTDYTCSKLDQTCRLDSAPAGTSCQSDASPDTRGLDADLSPPAVASTAPNDGATEVDREAGITVTFTQHVTNVGPSTFLVMDGTSQLAGSYSEQVAANSWHFTGSLAGGRLITVMLTSGVVNDQMVPLPASSFSFTTHDDEPPMLVSSTPLNMGMAASITSPIVLVFNEPVAAVDTITVVVSSGGSPVSGAITGSGDSKTWTFEGALPAASTINVSLGSGIVDLAGNHLTSTAFSFTTP
ncbi:hypothetical protein BH11MYX1_BH11MYX1_50740 [soil metagenome]